MKKTPEERLDSLLEERDEGAKGGEKAEELSPLAERLHLDAEGWEMLASALSLPNDVLLEAVKCRGYLVQRTWEKCSHCGKEFKGSTILVSFGAGWQAFCQEC